MALKWSRLTHSPPVHWRGRCRLGPLLLVPLLVLDITILALVTGTLVYSATSQRHGETIGIYWDGTAQADAAIVFLYATLPALDLPHTLAQLLAYLTSPRSSPATSRLHPAAALSGALVACLAWTALVPLTTLLDAIGWEQARDGTWEGLAGARAAVGVALAVGWGVGTGFDAVAVRRWRKGRRRGELERAREEGWRAGVELGALRGEGEGEGVKV